LKTEKRDVVWGDLQQTFSFFWGTKKDKRKNKDKFFPKKVEEPSRLEVFVWILHKQALLVLTDRVFFFTKSDEKKLFF